MLHTARKAITKGTLTAVLIAALSACSGGGGGGSAGSVPPVTPNAQAPNAQTPSAQTPTASPDVPQVAMTPPVAASLAYWIVSESGIEGLETKMPPATVQSIFNTTHTYEIMNMVNAPDPLPQAQHLLYYRDETLIAGDIASGKFTGMNGALYDDEAYQEPGNTTPLVQIADPLPYAQAAASTLHNAGKLFVYTIGQSTGPVGAFLTATLPSVSSYPDVIDFQTQSAEGTVSFAYEISNYATTYYGHGGHRMLVGIGADPTGLAETAANIESAYVQAFKNVPAASGFWLNLAVKSQSCVTCPLTIDYGPVLSFFKWLGY